MKLLIKGALIEGERKASVLVEDGKISRISTEDINVSDAEVVNAEGLWLLPGLVDLHVHTRVPGYEHKEDLNTVSLAAIYGGFTHILAMPNTDPPVDSPEIITSLYSISKDLPVNVFFAAAITKGRKGYEITEMGLLKESGARAFTDDGSWVPSDSVMLNACIYASEFDLLIISHAEKPELAGGFANYDINNLKSGMKFRLSLAEELAVYRDCRFAEVSGCRMHIAHISSKEAVKVLSMFRDRGARISCEITPHHLIFSTDKVDIYNPNYICNPPIRDEENREFLVESLKNGTIDIIATDHAPHPYYEKETVVKDTPPGIEGLETAFSAIYTYLIKKGEVGIGRILQAMSYTPASYLGVDTSIKEGNEANFFLFDPKIKWRVSPEDIVSKSKNNPFIGRELEGKVVATYCKGKFIRR